MNNQSLELVVQESHLPTTEAEHLRSAFAPLFEQAAQWATRVDGLVVTDVSQVREMKLARESRLALKEIRCNAERKRKELKEDVVRKGKAIDGLYNVIAYLVEPLEQKLLDMEKFAERKEQARLDERLKERIAALAYYEFETSNPAAYRELTDEDYEAILETARLRHQRIVAERGRLEQERLEKEKAEAEERERIRLENERLKAEAAAREAELKKQREAQAKAEAEHNAKLEAQRKAQEEALKKQREEQAKAEAAHRAELEKQRLAQEAAQKKQREEQAEKLRKEKLKIAAEQEARRKAEQELARREAEEKKRKEEEAEAKRREQFAPEKEKLELFLSRLSAVEVPALESEIGKSAANDLANMKRQFETAVRHFIGKL